MGPGGGLEKQQDGRSLEAELFRRLSAVAVSQHCQGELRALTYRHERVSAIGKVKSAEEHAGRSTFVPLNPAAS